MGSEPEPRRVEHEHHLQNVARARMDAGEEAPTTDDPHATLQLLDKVAKGALRPPSTLVAEISRLADSDKDRVWDKMPALARYLTGDDLLAIAVVVKYPLGAALERAKPIAPDRLRVLLRSLTEEQIAQLADSTIAFTRVRNSLSGPLGFELPLLARLPISICSKPRFVRWFIETTEGTVAAVALAQSGSPELAKTLDELKQWSWLDHLHIAHAYLTVKPGLQQLRNYTRDEAARSKLGRMLAPPKTGDDPVVDGPIARQEMVDNATHHGSTAALLDAAARGGTPAEGDKPKVLARIAGEHAGAVLEFAIATFLDLPTAIPLLASSRGVTAQHMQQLLLQEPLSEQRVAALRDHRLRTLVRRTIGLRTPLLSLFGDDRGTIHDTVVTTDALREWAYQDKDPTTRLWLAAGGDQDLRRSCKLVKRELGFDWVRQLPASASQVELRRFALNCGDAKATEFIHQHLLGDRVSKVDPEDNLVGMLPGDVYGRTADGRLEQELHAQGATPRQILERLGDLSAGERAAALANRGEMKEMFGTLTGADAVRAVFLLGPSIPQLLALPIVNEPGLLDYLRTRPAEEELQAVSRASLVRPARAMFPLTCPFLVYPSLYDPHTLARGLDRSDELLDWILDETEPSLALARLSMEPARTMAVPRFEARPHLYDKLPAYRHLLPRGRQGFDALAKKLDDDDSQREADLYRTGEPQIDHGADHRAQKLAAASGEKHLWDALEAIAHSHGGEASALALIQAAPPAEQIALLDGTHTATVQALKQMVGRSPQHLFPGLSTAHLLALPDAAAWMIEAEPAYALLARAHGDAAKQLGRILSSQADKATRFVQGLPDAAALTARERQTLDRLCSYVSNDDVLRALFKVRYGSAVDASFAGKELRKLWTTLARLPPAQVNQHVIRTFTHGNIGASASGEWYDRQVILEDTPHGLEGTEESYEDAAVLSAAEIETYYGLDAKGLELATRPGGWIEKVKTGYRVKKITDTPSFTATVLHEVGHSVDQLLGEHTELIYGRGGWKTYGVDQFEEWASEMGALKSVSGRDRTEVITAWKESLRAGRSVAEMVDAGHPARKLRADDPLAKHVADRFDYKHARHEDHGGRVFTTHGLQLASVAKATADVAPSEYAMSAPAEFFAECYVEYYREYRGTPETEAKKGGHLAAWIKDWFDSHVDKVRLSPERLNGSSDPSTGARPSKKA